MADTKISGLTALGAAPASGDLFEVVDVSDTSMAGTGTNKKIVASDLLTGVYVAGGTDVPVTDGGTGSSTASGARSNLGLGNAATGTIGTDVQAWDADLDALAGLTFADNKIPLLGNSHTATAGDYENWTGTWTPTWNNVTVGTGPTEQYDYMKLGKLVVARFYLNLGTGGALTGAPTLPIPTTQVITTTGIASGFARATVGGTVYPLAMQYGTSTTVAFRVQAYNPTLTGSVQYVTHAALSATVPGTWASGDILSGVIVYRSSA